MNAEVEYNWKTLNCEARFSFNSLIVIEAGHRFSHSKRFIENMKTFNTEVLIASIQKFTTAFMKSALAAVEMNDKVTESIRLLSPITHEGMKWDNSNFLKIKMQEEVSKATHN